MKVNRADGPAIVNRCWGADLLAIQEKRKGDRCRCTFEHENVGIIDQRCPRKVYQRTSFHRGFASEDNCRRWTVRINRQHAIMSRPADRARRQTCCTRSKHKTSLRTGHPFYGMEPGETYLFIRLRYFNFFSGFSYSANRSPRSYCGHSVCRR